jgi:hypothetical protein
VTVVPPELGWMTGTAISPPARNFAVSPERATRSGSAKLFTRPFSSRAEINVSIWSPCVLMTCARSAPNGAAVEAAPGKTPLKILLEIPPIIPPPIPFFALVFTVVLLLALALVPAVVPTLPC